MKLNLANSTCLNSCPADVTVEELAGICNQCSEQCATCGNQNSSYCVTCKSSLFHTPDFECVASCRSN